MESGENCEMSSERQSSDDVQESTSAEYTPLDVHDFTDDHNFESNLRRRKGKIISSAKETFENASRQLRRKVPYAGHLMTPRRLWLNKIPTQCDVVIEFPENAPDEALRWLLSRIRSQPPSGLELVVQVKAHESTRRNAFYISAPMNILFRAAEEARLPKRLRCDLGGALREFTTRESHCFQQHKSDDGNTTLFTSQERQWLVLQVLQGLRAGQTDLDALQGRAAVAEGQSIVAAWLETGLITQIFPLHEIKSLTQLQTSWVRQIFAPQPLDDIAEYFGVKVALYFAWLGHYTCALGVPAVFGTILYVILWGKGQMSQDIGHMLFSLFNVAWASLYLEAWKRYSAELAFRWGTLSTPPELLEPPRPLYKGPLVENNVTGRLEPKEAPAWKRHAFRYFVSFPVIGFCLFMVFVVMFVILRFQDWLDHNNVPDRGIAHCMFNLHKEWWDTKLPEESVFCCLNVIPKVLLAGTITLMDEAYYKLAVWLNDRENYRLQSKYENHLIAKVALFQFVNSFLSLFYIAFYLRDEEKLKEQLAGLLISRQIIGNLRESAIPYLIEQWKLAKLSFSLWGALSPTQDVQRTITDEPVIIGADKAIPEQNKSDSTQKMSKSENLSSKRNIGQAEIESTLYKYDGTFSDHLEMLVQMGYVVLFSAAFPLAGLCALINNLMEIRSDAFKLAHVHQRPFGQRVANIGTWQNALTLLSLAAVIVNCALIGLSGQVSRLWPGLSTSQTIILIVTLEHIMLGLRSALTWLLPELPSWLAAEIARAEHCRREMQCKGTSPRPTPPTPPSTTSTLPPDQEASNLDGSTTYDQSIESQLLDEAYNHDHVLHHYALRQLNFSTFKEDLSSHRNTEADGNLFKNRESSPDSQPSQTSTILIRPLHESTPPTSGASLTSLIQETNHGYGPNGTFVSNVSTLAFHPLHAMHLQEIPPFRKKSSDSTDRTGNSACSSPQRSHQRISTPPPQPQAVKVLEIPPFKSRKISMESSVHLHSSELTSNTGSTDILKPAPSWSNISVKPIQANEQQETGRAAAVSSKRLGDGAMVTAIPKIPIKTSSAAMSLQQHQNDKDQSLKNVNPSGSSTSHSPGNQNNTDEEVKAAELAAKKSRLRQKLVKSARSVGIFSLKLKERRQREAEKAANIAIEHAKALAKIPPMPQPGGELSLIPIEQLIQIEDIKIAPNLTPTPQPATAAPVAVTTSLPSTSTQATHQTQNNF